jgi:hypothetical protein
VIFKSNIAEDRANTNLLLSGLNPNALAFDIDGLIAAAAGIQRECRLPYFVIEKPEAWFKCVEAQLEDAKVVKPKDRYNKVLGSCWCTSSRSWHRLLMTPPLMRTPTLH